MADKKHVDAVKTLERLGYEYYDRNGHTDWYATMATPPADTALAEALDNVGLAFDKNSQYATTIRKAAAALRARPQAVAEGFVMVPVEPTGEMLAAGAYLAGQRNYEDSEIRNIYQDMLAASQSAATEVKS